MTRSDALQNRKRIMDAFHQITRHEITSLPSMSDIVKVSGLGRGTVYRHFPDMGALSFSFMAEGYEALFDVSREALRSAKTAEESTTALKDHLIRYRAFTLDNLHLLTTPECMTSEGYALAHKSQRQCVRRALRDMSNIGKQSPDMLETAVDIISRVSDPEHLKATGLKQGDLDLQAIPAIEMMVRFAIETATNLKN